MGDTDQNKKGCSLQLATSSAAVTSPKPQLEALPTYQPSDYRLSKTRVIGIVAIHAVALIAAPFTFTWAGLASFLIMYALTGLGITFCFHRMLSHRAFKVVTPIKWLFVIIGTLALQGGPIAWVATHRLHHAQSDEPLDPHSPRQRGFWWSHLTWNFYQHPALDSDEKLRRYALDMFQDPVVLFSERYGLLLNILSAVALYAIGYAIEGPETALSMVIWGGLLRLVWTWHVTWFVNSATHIWGYRNYKTSDDSRNIWWVGLLAMGEGWHNNHHADQRAARNGHRWYEVDVTYYLIKALSLVGLAYDLVPVSKKLVPETR